MREQALERGLRRHAAHDAVGRACADADLVVVCAPVAQLPAAVAGALAAAPASATVTDIGSTKAQPRARHRAPTTAAASSAAIPSAAPRRAGPAAPAAEIFDGATWFLTPVAETDPARYAGLRRLR